MSNEAQQPHGPTRADRKTAGGGIALGRAMERDTIAAAMRRRELLALPLAVFARDTRPLLTAAALQAFLVDIGRHQIKGKYLVIPKRLEATAVRLLRTK